MKRLLVSLGSGVIAGLILIAVVTVILILAVGGIREAFLAIGQNALIIAAAFLAMSLGSSFVAFFVLKGEKAPARWQAPSSSVAPESGKSGFWTQVILGALAFLLVVGLIILSIILFKWAALGLIVLILAILGTGAVVWLTRSWLRGLWENEGIRFLAIAVVVTFTIAWAILGTAYFLAGLGWLNQRIFAGFEMGLVEAAIVVALYHLNKLFSGVNQAALDHNPEYAGYALPWGEMAKKRIFLFVGTLIASTLVMTLINDQLWQFSILVATAFAGAAFISWRYAAEGVN